ncbi:IS701 family transposase [Actinomadura sp. DC4]|uniref:IS701 family transposase n=1 Tax=Actinomadura sp. DC4 TaxID=3055069 RepID=UPI0025B2390B|nr:IS701 family transposase [Actinomadura sp. DC4]MDN3355967.1 IS701 family transposase [Actinomadura sp. DC4]
MELGEIAAVRSRLEEFTAEVFASLARSDQRVTGGLYVRGLLLDGQRKSMQPMAERLGVDHQRLQQFMSSSTWDFAAVRRRLAARVQRVVGPVAWVIDDTGFPKYGTSSPGVARQYSGTLGKVGNCQIGVSVHAVTDHASAALDWRLFIPESWDDACTDDTGIAEQVQRRRARAGIPDGERNRPKWQLAIEMLDELRGWGLEVPVICADAGYGDNALFRAALAERDLGYIVQVKGTATAHAADAVPELLPHRDKRWRGLPRYRDKPISLREHVLAAGRTAARRVVWRQGSKGELAAEFVALRIRPAGRRPRYNEDGTLPAAWLIAQWPAEEDEPVKYWLSNLPAHTPLHDLVRWGKIRWRIEHDYRELKTGLGIDHYEGRTWTGWNRHLTLVTAAHLFLTTLRLTSPKAAGAA